MTEHINTPTHSGPHRAGPHARLMQAWRWLEDQRNSAPDHADVWDIRWQHRKSGTAWLTGLLRTLQAGEYRLSPMQIYGEGADKKAVWGAQDALVLKWVALSIQDCLPLHPACEHVRGHGGGKQSIGKLHHLLMQTGTSVTTEKKTADDTLSPESGAVRDYRWVCRTDIRGYYRHINKATLLSQVKRHVSDPVLTDLVGQYIHYTVEDGGTFHTPQTGISRGCALSPLMGALHLYDMDAHFSAREDIHYARYMDDIIILAKTRWSLRRHTKRLMQWFNEYGFEAHPDKTQIGKTEKGFDWMGAWLTHDGVTDIAPRAKANHREKVRRLYEQLARVPKWLRHRRQKQVHARVSTYRKRWNIWAGAALALCTYGVAHADRPIVVLAPNLPSSTEVLPGGDFSTSASGTSTVTQAPTSKNTGLINITGKSNGDYTTPGLVAGGIRWGVRVPGTSYVGQKILSRNLYLVGTRGHISAQTTDENAATVPVDPTYTSGVDCNRISKPSSSVIQCDTLNPFQLKVGDPAAYPIGTKVRYNVQISFAPYCASCTPGLTNITEFYLGHYWQNPSVTPLNKPTAIVVSGLSCNLDSTNSTLSLNPRNDNTANILAGSAPLALTLTCSGTNTSGQSIPVGVNFRPTGASYSQSNQLRAANQPSFYSTLAVNQPACSGASLMKLGDGTSNAWHTYAAGATDGAAYTKNLIWSLCTTGDPSQAPGQYQMTMTASIVSY